jgi:predicted lipoprotein with Yx(FWY)xxD motif
MRISAIAWVIVILIIVAGGWYYYMSQSSAPAATAPAADTTTQQLSSSGAAGINGSANQGNLGQPGNGTVQQPGADGAQGSVIGANLALGTNKSATLGTYLIAYNGMTLYTFANDTGAASTCYGACATNWPAYVVGPEDNLTQLQAGVTGKVATTKRTDGSLQVTYNGHPLYFFIGDKASGDTNGQNVGKVWFVVKP